VRLGIRRQQVVVADAALQREPAARPLILRVEIGRQEIADVLAELGYTIVCVIRFTWPLFIRTAITSLKKWYSWLGFMKPPWYPNFMLCAPVTYEMDARVAAMVPIR